MANGSANGSAPDPEPPAKTEPGRNQQLTELRLGLLDLGEVTDKEGQVFRVDETE